MPMGGLIQLVSIGAQDVALTGEPNASLWNSSYNRGKLFSLESIEQSIVGPVNYGESCSFTLSRSGDLVAGLMFELTLRRGASTVSDPRPYYPAEHFFEGIEMLIGGQRIDFISHNWLRLYAQMYYNKTQAITYDNMTNFGVETDGQERTFFVPVPFFFNNAWNTKLAIPLIALQYHEVEFRLKFANGANILGIDTTFTPKLRVYADYVFLDSPERLWFAQNPHEYVITQVQTQKSVVTIDTNNRNYKLYMNLNHPVKVVSWVLTPGDAYHGRFTCLPGDTTDNTAAPIQHTTIVIDGNERFSTRPGRYFQVANPWLSMYGMSVSAGVYVYNFGINDYIGLTQRGTMNFSRVDNSMLKFTTKSAVIATPRTQLTTTESQTYAENTMLTTAEVYAVNYNVFRIMSGMGGLAFAN